MIVFEPLDNVFTRLGVRLGMGQEYEVAAVAGAAAGSPVSGTARIPNYVYRWTGPKWRKRSTVTPQSEDTSSSTSTSSAFPGIARR